MTVKEKLINCIDTKEGSEPLTNALKSMFIEFCRCEIDWPQEKRQEIAHQYEVIEDIIKLSYEFSKEEERNDFERKIGL